MESDEMKTKIKRVLVNVGLVAALTFQISAGIAAQERVFFGSSRTGGGDVYSIRPDGSLPTQLTNHPEYDSDPSVTADGSKVAFVSLRDFPSQWDRQEIYVMNADGSGQTRLTNNFAWDLDPAISPDGSRIAFASNRNGPFQLFIMNADGTNPTALGGFGLHPAFSPDGTKIVYTGYDGNDYEIYTVNVDGTNNTQITQNTAADRHPAFSPDGNRIAFVSDRDGDVAVFIMNADSTAQTRLVGTFTDLFFDPNDVSFSPDGTRLAFMMRVGGNAEIHAIDLATLTSARLTDNFAYDVQPSWSGPVFTPPVFGAPSNLRVDYIGVNFVNLRWNDNSNNEAGFIIEQCRNKTCTNTIQMGQVGADITRFLVTPLLANTQYTFRVAAINADAERTPYSNTVTVKTLRK
jgi:Tol biopolymer transport system component